jgi:hypothetical protein
MGKEAGKSMGTVDERVKKIIGEQLPKPVSWKTLAPTRSILLSW